MKQNDLSSFLSTAIKANAYTSGKSLRYMCESVFDGVELRGAKLLDVGGGTGLLSLYGAVMGATSVCVEPSGAGSSEGIKAVFDRLQSSIEGGSKAVFVQTEIETFLETNKELFDVVVIANTINHLDENACITLRESKKSWERYIDLICQIKKSMSEGGWLIITDCGRRNLFGDLGLRSPVMKTIEWEKHQEPKIWKNLLAECGFQTMSMRWSSPNRLGKLGKVFLSNRLVSYLLFSHFRLAAKKK